MIKIDIFKLIGSIFINNEDANEEIDKTTGKAEKSQSKIGRAFGKIGSAAMKVGKVIGVGLIAGTTALAGLSTAAVNTYADYEQLKGGIETLFGAGGQTLEKYAESVGLSVDEAREKYGQLQQAEQTMMEHSKEAFREAGMSANEYMETATSFSASLIQSLDGDTVKAAELSNKAIVDMSDNANKMGTSLESIQNAYKGFSKQNFTMLDNLSLGYGGTKQEMERLLDDAEKIKAKNGEMVEYSIDSYADMIEAIHTVQDSMGIAGTTHEEAAETISGSIGMMKASWTDFLGGMADPEQDFDQLVGNLVDSVVTVAGNLVPRIVVLLPRLVQGLSQVVQSLAVHIPDIFSTLLPVLISAASSLLTVFVSMLPTVLSTLIQILPQVIEVIIQIFNGIVAALPEIIILLVDALPELLPQLTEGAIQLVIGLVENLPTIIQALIDSLPIVIASILLALAPLGEQLLNLASSCMEGIKQKFKSGFDSAVGLVESAISKIKGLFNFSVSLPKIKLPHFKVNPSGWKLDDLLKGTIPTLGVDWYAKGGVMTKPTIFGYNDATNRAQVGGEAGPEAVAPIDVLQGYVAQAVASQNGSVIDTLNRLFDRLFTMFEQYFPEFSRQMVLDTGVLVTELAPKMDSEFGRIQTYRGRGN